MNILKMAVAAGGILLASTAFAGSNNSKSTDIAISRAGSLANQYVIKAAKREMSFSAYLTGYSYWDNTPPGSAAIARPVVHRRAGGKGTFRDPITIAVGYRLRGRRSLLDFPAGTRFYLPSIKRYAIVEDICGDGPRPHLTGCHRGRNGAPWLDIYVDGRKAGAAASRNCMNRITGMQEFIINPRRGYPVYAGALTEAGCGSPST